MKQYALSTANKLLIAALLSALFITAMLFRPLLPIDETRYMSVAWEMYLRGDWLTPLTVNFAPYHHKPPLLFWLINGSWSIFGVSRWAGALPMFLASIICIYLTKKLADALFPDKKEQTQIIPFLMIGSFPFLIYGTLVMFDITLTVFVLLSLLSLVSFAKTGNKKFILAMALSMGLGVLTKGPVMWLYIIFPIIFGSLWNGNKLNKKQWYGGCITALILSVIPVALWIIPVLQASSNDFAFWLLWNQTAGRVTGNFSSSHARPIYFYLILLPILFLPWLAFPSFWKGVKNVKEQAKSDLGIRFILISTLPVFIAFSLISGKQPHYLVPLLPQIIILIAIMAKIPNNKAIITASIMIAIIITGQIIASNSFFKKYDLRPIATYIKAHEDIHDWAFVKKYHGEFTFIGRLEKPVERENFHTLDEWFKNHPNGKAIVRYSDDDPMEKYKKIIDIPYRGKHMAIFIPKE